MLPCRKPACFVVNRGSGVVHRAAIEHFASMKWSAASISRTRTSMSRTCTSTSRTKASAWRTCRERQLSCQCLHLKRYNGNDHRAAAIDLQAEKAARPAAPCASYCYSSFDSRADVPLGVVRVSSREHFPSGYVDPKDQKAKYQSD